MKTTLPPILGALLLAASAAAQTQIQIDVRSTYLRPRAQDTAATNPTPIVLSSIGAAPGQWLEITTVGAYVDPNFSGADAQTSITCVFSSSGLLLPANVLNRLPGAISAGPSWNTNTVWRTDDIPQDMIAPPTYVQVPNGALFLFLAPLEARDWGNNTDPNGDFRVVLTVKTPPAALFGTQEHALLTTGISPAPPTAFPDVYPVAGNSLVNINVSAGYGAGQSVGEIVLLGFDFGPTSPALPAATLPGLYLGPNTTLFAGVVSTTPFSFFLFVPPGLNGNSVILQGAFFSPQRARNGLFMSTDAHVLTL